MKKQNYLKQGAIILFMLFIFASCAKDVIKPQDENLTMVSEKEKSQKIERFISITWETPSDRILFNKDTQEFTFGPKGEYKLSKKEMERLYDRSNEYKAKYEKN